MGIYGREQGNRETEERREKEIGCKDERRGHEDKGIKWRDKGVDGKMRKDEE